MSNGIKISQLPDGGPTASSDFVPVERGSVTFKIPTNQFVVDGQNVATGAGAQLFIGKQTDAGSILQFRTLSGTDGISVVNIGNTTVVSGSGQNPIKTVFTGTGSQVNFPFTLTNTSSRNVNNYRVDIDGVLQEPGQTADYYLNGPNLTFTSAPPLSSKIVVISNNLLPLAESVPPDNSVTTAKLSAGAVTAEKMSGGQTGGAPIFGVRAWVYFNGLSANATLVDGEYQCNIRREGNVSKVVWLSAGQYDVHFKIALPHDEYAIIGSAERVGPNEHFIPRILQSTSAIARVNTQFTPRVNPVDTITNTVSAVSQYFDADEIHTLFIG